MATIGTAASQAPSPSNAETAAPPMLFGMDAGSAGTQAAAGVAPDLGTFWVGPWTLKHGWGGPDAQMRSMRDQGVTPAIHHYYWGDDISQDCINNGCWSDLHGSWKDQAGWQQLTDQLVQHLNSQMQGKPVYIYLETEFNKADLQTYEPLDAMLASKAQQIKQGYPQAQVVLALGGWNTPAWKTWDRAAAASDLIGLQGMRGSTRDSAAHYDALYEDTLRNVKTARDTFAKPVVLMDLALSTYPEPQYVQKQADELGQFFAGIGELKAAGVQAMVYRSWKDTNMDLANYYGQAERHWGLAYQDGTHKPSAAVWIDGVKAERATPGGTPSQPPAPFSATFTPSKNNNEWWVEVTVSASSSPAQVQAKHNDGAWTSLPKTSWGAYARSFNAPAGGTMTFRAADAYGQTASQAFAWLQPVNRAPTAAFTGSAEGLHVSLDGAGSSDPDGDPLAYRWDLGDGTQKTGVKTSHTYAAAGTYQVRLTVDDGKAQNTAQKSMVVAQPNRAPIAAFDHNADALSVHLLSKATDPDGDTLVHRWTLGDGTTATGIEVRHTYKAPGQYVVALTADDGKAQTTTSKAVTATAPAYAPTISMAKNVNPYWIEFHVSQASKVQVKHDDGPWRALDANSWGTWSKSFAAPAGGTMLVQATGPYGQLASKSFAWLPEQVWNPTITPTKSSNEWWVEVTVTGGSPSQVLARQGDGSWQELQKTSWGTWAKSFYAPAGTMTFRAVDGFGSGKETTVQWLEPTKPLVTFEAKTQQNGWWVEVKVTSKSHVQRVDVHMDGKWIKLDPTSWGTYAKGMKAQGEVVFRATTSDGIATSAPMMWG